MRSTRRLLLGLCTACLFVAPEPADAAPPRRPSTSRRPPSAKRKRRETRPVLRTTACAKLFQPPQGATRPFQGQCTRPSSTRLGKVRRRAGSNAWIGASGKTFTCSGRGFTTAGGSSVSGIACEFDAIAEPDTAIYANAGESIANVSSDVLANYMCGCHEGRNTGAQGAREAWNTKGFWMYRVDGEPEPATGVPPHLRLDPPAWPEPDRDVVLRRKTGFVMWFDKAYKRFHAKCLPMAQRGVDERGDVSVLREGKLKRCGHGSSTCNRWDGTDQAIMSCSLRGSGGEFSGRTGTCTWLDAPSGTQVRSIEMRSNAGGSGQVHADDLTRYACGNYRPDSMAPFRYTGGHGGKESWSPSGNVWTYAK